MSLGLPSSVVDYLAPQERFDALRSRAIARAGTGLCDLAYANPYDGPAPTAIEAIRQSLESDRTLDLQYTPYGGSTITRRLVAQQLSRSHGERFNWRNVVMTPGAMAALNILFRAATVEDEKGEVVVVTPCWLDYPLYLENLGIPAKFVPLVEDSWDLDIDRLRSALSARTRALVLSQPCNPSGSLYSVDTLRALAEALEGCGSKPLLISDECHRDVIFSGETFHSPLEFYDATCVVYSFGKSLFIQGQRIGYVAISPRFPDARGMSGLLERLCRVMGFCTPTSLMQLAVRRLLHVDHSFAAIQARRDTAYARLADAGFSLFKSQATFFLYPRAPVADDFAYCERLADRGVLVLPSSIFHQAGYFRISLTATDEMLVRALDILCEDGG